MSFPVRKHIQPILASKLFNAVAVTALVALFKAWKTDHISP
jgi:hypothetical protein